MESSELLGGQTAAKQQISKGKRAPKDVNKKTLQSKAMPFADRKWQL